MATRTGTAASGRGPGLDPGPTRARFNTARTLPGCRTPMVMATTPRCQSVRRQICAAGRPLVPSGPLPYDERCESASFAAGGASQVRTGRVPAPVGMWCADGCSDRRTGHPRRTGRGAACVVAFTLHEGSERWRRRRHLPGASSSAVIVPIRGHGRGDRLPSAGRRSRHIPSGTARVGHGSHRSPFVVVVRRHRPPSLGGRGARSAPTRSGSGTCSWSASDWACGCS
jgi:hypothetical protein